MKHFFSIIRFLIVAAAVVCVQCADMTGGGTIETTNGLVTGRVVLPGGGPAARTQVRLFPAGYDLVKDTAAVPTDTTDTMGNYAIAHVRPGDYTIQAVHLDDRTRALVSGIHSANDTVAAPAGTLQAPGAIRVYLPGGVVNGVTGYVYLPGAACLVFLNNQTEFVILDSVPAGVIPAVSYSSISLTASAVIRYNVTVDPGDTTVVYNPSWKYARRLALNTSSSGAAVSGNVVDFPVLVRLNAGNFDFSHAQAGGADIRFTKKDNTPEPYEIERWDAASQLAEIWVRVDTVYGNNAAQSITLYWGNSTAPDSSNGAAVFDTANGFQGAWHLGENASTIRDATNNGYNGSANGTQALAEGIIGYCQSYVDSGAYTDYGNILNPGNANMTVSAWIKCSKNGGINTIIGKSNGGKPALNYGWLMTINFGYLAFYASTVTGNWGDIGSFWYQASVPIADTTTWHFLVAVIDRSANSNCKLYIDGNDASQTPSGDITTVGTVINTLNMRIGEQANNGLPFRGFIDEAVVAFTTRSADWIKLCYMNQQQDNKLVEFR